MNTLIDYCMKKEHLNRVVISTFDHDYTVQDIEQLNNEFLDMLGPTSDLTGKRVALLVPQTLAYISLVFVINKLGGTVIPLSPQHREGDLSAILSSASPHMIFTIKHLNGMPYSDVMKEWIRGNNAECTLFESEEGMDWKRTDFEGKQAVKDTFDRHFILFTSGSTGVPKGVVMGQEVIIHHMGIIPRLINGQEGDRYLHIPPQTVAFGLVGILCAIHLGYRVAIPNQFDLPKIMNMMNRVGVQKVVSTPSILKGMYNLSKAIDPLVFQNIKECYLAGEMVNPGEVNEFTLMEKTKFIGVYGITEAGGIMTCDLRGELEWDVDEVYQFKVVEEELFLKSPAIFTCYYNQLGMTKEVLQEDGWFQTGDLAYLTPEHKVVIQGRKKDVIKKGGQQVIPGEVEKTLENYKSVKQAAVIGAPHSVYGEQVVAYIVAEQDVNTKELYHYCANKIAAYKVPDHIELIDEIPMTSGKTDKNTLRKRFKNKEKTLKK
ncbi:class I adenylate-forming enzyme family protein [Salinibacillus xinjiangensis]|nr:class I adenylate-forming enzyme family protein [Salinibacillus xinjiangensis]